jgi:hypothetical protein
MENVFELFERRDILPLFTGGKEEQVKVPLPLFLCHQSLNMGLIGSPPFGYNGKNVNKKIDCGGDALHMVFSLARTVSWFSL